MPKPSKMREVLLSEEQLQIIAAALLTHLGAVSSIGVSYEQWLAARQKIGDVASHVQHELDLAKFLRERPVPESR